MRKCITEESEPPLNNTHAKDSDNFNPSVASTAAEYRNLSSSKYQLPFREFCSAMFEGSIGAASRDAPGRVPGSCSAPRSDPRRAGARALTTLRRATRRAHRSAN
eukprot:1461514-Pleurochrysis_carterae.AAC.2